MSGTSRRLQFIQKIRLAIFLPGRRELGATRGEVENVNRHLTFSVNQRNLDIAVLMGKPGADSVEQAETVLSNHLYQRAAGRTLIIEFNPGLYLHFGYTFRFRAHAVAQHAVEVRLAIDDIRNAALKAVPLGEVQLHCAKTVSKVESVHHHSGRI